MDVKCEPCSLFVMACNPKLSNNFYRMIYAYLLLYHLPSFRKTMTYSKVGFLKFAEEKHKKAVLRIMEPLVQHVRDNEPGTINYSFMEDVDDPLTWIIVEEFVDEQAHELHVTSDVFQKAMEEVGSMVEAHQLVLDLKASKTPLVTGFGHRT